MQMKMGRIVFVLCMWTMLIGVTPTLVYAETDNFSGTCGENLIWTLSSDGVLTISGDGEMMDYSMDEKAPWYEIRDQIISVVVDNGVTRIGNYGFNGHYSMTCVSLPESMNEKSNPPAMLGRIE